MNRLTFTVFGISFAVLLCVPANAQTFTFRTLDDNNPYAVETYAYGISGNNVVGLFSSSYNNDANGFIYNGSTYTTLNDPLGERGTELFAISGNNIVGAYWDAFYHLYNFIYNGSTYTTLNDPSAVGNTYPQGISGNNVVGSYQDLAGHNHGFLYNGSTYTTR